MSAREAENGFVRERFVSSRRARRNIRRENENDFNEVKMRGFRTRNAFLPRPACGERSDHIADVIRVRGYRSIDRSRSPREAPHPNPLPARAGRGSAAAL